MSKISLHTMVIKEWNFRTPNKKTFSCSSIEKDRSLKLSASPFKLSHCESLCIKLGRVHFATFFRELNAIWLLLILTYRELLVSLNDQVLSLSSRFAFKCCISMRE